MTLAFVVKLRLKLRLTKVKAQRTNGLLLETHGMVSTRFSLQDSLEKI